VGGVVGAVVWCVLWLELGVVLWLDELMLLLVPDTVIDVDVLGAVVWLDVVDVWLEVVGDVSLEVVGDVSLEVVGDVSLEVVGDVWLEVVLDVSVVLLEVELTEMLVLDEVVVEELVVVVPPTQCEITNWPLQSAGTTAVASVTDRPPLSDTTYLPVDPGLLSSGALVLLPPDRNTVMLDGGWSILVITKYAPVAPSHPLYWATDAALTWTVWVSVAAADGAVCSISITPSPAAAMPASSRTTRPEIADIAAPRSVGGWSPGATPNGCGPGAWRSYRYGTYPVLARSSLIRVETTAPNG
jgi:hypothetical protein